MNAYELGQLCLSAPAAGPHAFANAFLDEERGCAIERGGPAVRDLLGQPDAFPPMVWIPLKLSTLAAAQLAAIGTLLVFGPPSRVGITSLGRSILEGCGAVSWVLDDTVTPEVCHRRTWLVWAVAEGNAAVTAGADIRRTGAMTGSPQRLADIEAAIEHSLGVRLERSHRTKPKDWRLGGESLPGHQDLIVRAVERWFDGGDGKTLYRQVSRQAHSDALVALALVDNMLAIPSGEGYEFVPTVLVFWAQTWNLILSYLGVSSSEFEAWRRKVLKAIGRRDLVEQ